MHARYIGEAELLKGKESPAPAPPAADSTSAPKEPPAVAASRGQVPWAWAVACAAAILFIGMWLLYRLRLREPKATRRRDELVALRVSEALAAIDGSPGVTNNDRKVEVAVGVPAVFSTDPILATFIAAKVEGGPNGELFRIVPREDGTISIRSSHGALTADGEEVRGERRMRIDSTSSLRLRLGEREYRVSGVFGREATPAREDLFEAEALHL
jgi:hypothetical protein